MPHCKFDCKFQDMLQSQEEKANKLRCALDDLEDLLYHEPHWLWEIELKRAHINEKLEETLSDARDLTVTIANGCEACNREM